MRLAEKARQQVATYGSNPFLFSLFIFISSSVVTVTGHCDPMGTFCLLAILNFISILLCSGLLLRPRWKPALAKYFDLYWLLTIAYALVFVNVFSFLHDPQDPVAVIKLTIMVCLLVMMLDWRSALLLGIVGTGAALGCCRIHTGVWLPALTFETKWMLAWGTLPAIVLGFFFTRKGAIQSHQKQRPIAYTNVDDAKALQTQKEITHQLNSVLDERSSMISALHNSVDLLRSEGANKDHLQKIQDTLTYLSELKMKSMTYLPLDLAQVSLKQLLRGAAAAMKSRSLPGISNITCYQTNRGRKVVCDPYYLRKLLTNGITHLARYHKGKPHYCYVGDTVINHNIPGMQHLPAYRIVITTEPNPKLPQVYTLPTSTAHFAQDQQHLEENRRIATAHYGTMVLKEGRLSCCQTYVMPRDLPAIRPNSNLFADEDLASISIDAPADRAFLAVLATQGMDTTTVKKALKRCKHYHRRKKCSSGDPYYLRPVAVATILYNYTREEELIIAGLLHGVMEDAPYGLQQIRVEFGQRVATIIAATSNLHHTTTHKIKRPQEEVLAQIVAANNRDVLLVKLADHLHEMRTSAGLSMHMMEEAAGCFIPMAQRLDMQKIKQELIDRIALTSGKAASLPHIDQK